MRWTFAFYTVLQNYTAVILTSEPPAWPLRGLLNGRYTYTLFSVCALGTEICREHGIGYRWLDHKTLGFCNSKRLFVFMIQCHCLSLFIVRFWGSLWTTFVNGFPLGIYTAVSARDVYGFFILWHDDPPPSYHQTTKLGQASSGFRRHNSGCLGTSWLASSPLLFLLALLITVMANNYMYQRINILATIYRHGDFKRNSCQMGTLRRDSLAWHSRYQEKYACVAEGWLGK